jgi:tetratricopeptide (TPR) repeat protein
MLRALAGFLNESGNSARNRCWPRLSAALYRLASAIAPEWSAPWYNLGLQRKYEGDWKHSLRCNQRAAELDPEDEASWWNLGIAATALNDWAEARRAWEKVGVSVSEEEGEIRMAETTGCVRIDPRGCGEVVWGTRIDPARTRVLNVPLPESQRRFGDVLLQDGAQEGSRTSNGHEYPVFNELALWKASSYSTFQVTVLAPSHEAADRLMSLCMERDFGCEDWGTIRRLCKQCSLGNPEPHACIAAEEQQGRLYGFGASSREALVDLLEKWAKSAPGLSFENVELRLMANQEQ